MLAFYLSLIENEKGKRQFEDIYFAYKNQMYLLALKLLNNKHDAEDIVHDVFCSVASSHMDIITNAECEKDIRNYLLKSVKNASISLIRKRKIRSDYENMKKKEKIELGDNEFLNRLCNKMEVESLMNAMADMDEKYQEVLYYRFVLGLSTSETAKILGRPANTVKIQISRAKHILADSLFEKEN